MYRNIVTLYLCPDWSSWSSYCSVMDERWLLKIDPDSLCTCLGKKHISIHMLLSGYFTGPLHYLVQTILIFKRQNQNTKQKYKIDSEKAQKNKANHVLSMWKTTIFSGKTRHRLFFLWIASQFASNVSLLLINVPRYLYVSTHSTIWLILLNASLVQ